MKNPYNPGENAAKELYSLADRYCDQRLTPEEAQRLNNLLRDNIEAQHRFLERTAMHARLQLEFGPSIAAPRPMNEPRPGRSAPTGSVPSRRRNRWLRSVLWAGAALAATVFLAVSGFQSVPAKIAVLADVSSPCWSDGTAMPKRGDELRPGRLVLVSGLAKIEFNTGAIALVEGPADFDLLSSERVYLHSGQVVIRGPLDGTGGFKLETPTARLRDIGTEFGVKVGGAGDTELQVYEGEVIAELKDSPSPGDKEERVAGGQAIRINSVPRSTSQELDFWPERFIRYLPGPDDPHGRGNFPYNVSVYDSVHIVPAPRDVVIDGDLSDWDLSGRFRGACEAPYGEHYFVEGAMMYDERFLYISAHVGDPFPMRSTINPHIKRDLYGSGGSVAFRLSTDRKLGWPIQGENFTIRNGRPPSPADANDKLIFLVLWYYRAEQLACMHIRYNMDLQGVRVNPPGYRGVFKQDADGQGYLLEYAIPWSLLHAAVDPPRGGDVLGATWLTHWSDAEGRVWKGQWIDVTNPTEKGWNFERAATWGKAIYHKTGHLPPGTVTSH